ncbi:hypothetical protein EBT23_03690 [bacterium]|nr:hypothetical protein [bacterium]
MDLRKETMRISLPPRPASAGAKPAGTPTATVALPAATKPPMPGASPAAKPGGAPAPAVVGAAKTPAAAPAGAKPAMATAVGVRTVVDTDSAGTALAIAALVASLISFGVVLMSFLQK